MLEIYGLLFFISLISYITCIGIYFNKRSKYMTNFKNYLNKKQHNYVQYNIKIGYPTRKIYEKKIMYSLFGEEKEAFTETNKYKCYKFELKGVEDSISYMKNLNFEDKDMFLEKNNSGYKHFIVNENNKVIIYNDIIENPNIKTIINYTEENINKIYEQYFLNNNIIDLFYKNIFLFHLFLTTSFFIFSNLLEHFNYKKEATLWVTIFQFLIIIR